MLNSDCTEDYVSSDKVKINKKTDEYGAISRREYDIFRMAQKLQMCRVFVQNDNKCCKILLVFCGIQYVPGITLSGYIFHLFVSFCQKYNFKLRQTKEKF